MSKAVCVVFDDNKNVWENQPLAASAYNRLQSLCEEVNQATAQQQENAPEGHTAAKENARTALEDMLFTAGRKLRAFARLEDDAVAENHSNFSRSGLDALSLNNLLNLSRSVAEVCKVRLEALKLYGSDADLTELQAATDKLATLNAHRDAIVDLRMAHTSSITDC